MTRYFLALVRSYARLRFAVYLPIHHKLVALSAPVQAFRFLGGVPQRIFYNNPKPLVKRHADLFRRGRLSTFASHYGLLYQPCWPSSAADQGQVDHERDVLLGLDSG